MDILYFSIMSGTVRQGAADAASERREKLAYSGIGGQAVMEGVMMKNAESYAVAVRKPDHEIVVEKKEYEGICRNETIRNLIFVRGIINFIESMILGMSCLTFSASFFEGKRFRKKNGTGRKKRRKLELPSACLWCLQWQFLWYFHFICLCCFRSL